MNRVAGQSQNRAELTARYTERSFYPNSPLPSLPVTVPLYDNQSDTRSELS